MKKILLLMMSVLLVTVVGYSQAPAIFNYQGVARNSVGNVLVNKNITLRLTIHDGAAAGPVVYQETRPATTNPFGLFNVQVGSPGANPVVGTVAGVNWGVGSKFIQVEIDPNGGTTFINIGTAQIASVPYALYANQSGDLILPYNRTQADAGTLFKITNSGTGSGSTALEGLTNSTANNVSAIIGTVTSTSPGSSSAGVKGINNGTGSGGIGVWGSQNGSGWGVYGQAPIGVGVFGASTSGTGVYGNSNTGRSGHFEITNAASAATSLFSTTMGTGIAMHAQNFGSSGRAGMIQISNTINPASALYATTNGTGWAGEFVSTNGTPLALRTAGGVRLTGINEGLNRILSSNATGDATWQNPSAIGLVTGSGTLNFVPKWTPNGTNLGNSEIFDNGFMVGLGTITPFNTQLHIASDGVPANGYAGVRFTTPTSQATFGGLYVGLNLITGAQDVYIGTNESTSMGFYTTGTNRINITSNGMVGVGIPSPSARLHARGTGTNYAPTVNVQSHQSAMLAENTLASPTNLNAGLVAFGSGSVNANRGVFGVAGGTGTNFNVGVGGIAAETSTGTNYGIIGFAQNGANNFAAAFFGKTQISDGTQGLNRVFTSDATGVGSWVPLGALGSVGGSGTLNYIPKWTPDGFTLGNSQVFDDGSRINIGTDLSDPNSVTINNTNASGGNATISLQSGNGFNEPGGIYMEDATGNMHFTLNSYSAAAGAKIMTLDDDNLNVGIGTSTPLGLSRLHVNNDQGTTAGIGLYSQGDFYGILARNTGTTARSFAVGINAEIAGSNFNFGYAAYTNADGAGLGGFNIGTYASANNNTGTNLGIYSIVPAGPNNYAARFDGRIIINDGTQGDGKVLTSDASGIASWQGPTAFKISGSTAPIAAPLFTFVPVTVWANVEYEKGSLGAYNPVTGEYTVPSSGTYHVEVRYDWDAPAANGSAYTGTGIFVNGIFQYASHNNIQTINLISGASLSTDIELTAGDLVSFRIFHNTSGVVTAFSSFSPDDYFSIHKVK